MFDRVRSRTERCANTGRALRMSGYADTGVVGLIADCRHLLLGHLRAPGVTDSASVRHARGSRHLDRLDSPLHIDTGISASLPRGIAGESDLRRSVPSGDGEQRSRAEYPRAAVFAPLDFVRDLDDLVGHVADTANRGDS